MEIIVQETTFKTNLRLYPRIDYILNSNKNNNYSEVHQLVMTIPSDEILNAIKLNQALKVFCLIFSIWLFIHPMYE